MKSILRTSTVFLLAVLFGWCLFACAKPLPIMGEIPAFSLIDQTGKPVTKGDLTGSVWIADFIYTGCSAACPMLTQRMSEMSRDLGPGIRLVSFTVDPETDTPERLKEYAERFGAKPESWSFLTGPVEQVRSTVSDGFKLSLQKASATDIFHSEKLVLVDRQGKIRGYFDSDAAGVKALVAAANSLK